MALEGFKRFIGLSSFEMMIMFRRGLFYAYLSIYLRHYLGMSVTETTLFATLPMVANILSQTFIWGKISDLFQLRRTLIILGEVLAGFGTIAVWYIHRMPEQPRIAGYAVILGLTGIEVFWAMSNISWSALVSDLYVAGERGTVQGRLASMGGVGRLAGVWMGGMLYDGMGAHFDGWGFFEGTLFFISAGVMFLSTIPLLFLPEGGVKTQAVEDAAVSGEKSDDPAATTGVYLVFLIAMVLINFGRNSIAIIFPQYLSLETGLAVDSRTLSYIVNLQSVSIILFGWTAGRIGKAVGNERALLGGIGISVIAVALLAGSTQMIAVCLSSFLRGIGDVLIMATSYTLASVLIPPKLRARRFAWFNATFFLSWGLAGSLITGPMTDLMIAAGKSESMAYRLSFALACVTTFLGMITMYFLLSHKRRVEVE